MLYRYVAALEFVGLHCSQGEAVEKRIPLPTLNATARMTADIDLALRDLDRRSVIRDMLLGGSPGSGAGDAMDQRLAQQVLILQKHRQAHCSGGAYFVFEAAGEIENFDPQPQREIAGCIVSMPGETHHEKIRGKYVHAITALIASFAVYGDRFHHVKKVADGITFLRADGTPIHCYEMQGHGRAFVSSVVDTQVLDSVAQRWQTLLDDPLLTSSTQLFSRSLADDGDALLAFFSAWNALEIFVNKNFDTYESALGRTAPDRPERPFAGTRHLDRPLGPRDKFAAIASELCDSDAESDKGVFKSIGEVRNALFHRGRVSVPSLPVAEVRALLRKYLRLHLESQSQRAPISPEPDDDQNHGEQDKSEEAMTPPGA